MAENNTKSHAHDNILHVEKSSEDKQMQLASGSADIPDGYFPTTAEEKAMSRSLNRKLDMYLLPFLSLLYLFNGLDRGNVGNAETQGQYRLLLWSSLVLRISTRRLHQRYRRQTL